MKKTLLFLIFFTISLNAQLRKTNETSEVAELVNTIVFNYSLILQKETKFNKDSILITIKNDENKLKSLKGNKSFWTKVQLSNGSLKAALDKYELVKTYLKSLSLIEYNKEKWKRYKIGDQVCYYVEDQRDGYIMVHFQIQGRTETALLGLITGIDNFDPYNSLNNQIESVRQATVNGVAYVVGRKFYFNQTLINYLKECDVIR